MARNYSNIALDTTLNAGITAVDLTCVVASATGWPAVPFAAVLDPGSLTIEEVVQVTLKVGTTFTITRGFDGTTASAHALGATVRHAAIAGDFTDLQAADATNALAIANEATARGNADATLAGLITAEASTRSAADLLLTPMARTLTINGVAFDLSANRSWTTPAGTVTGVTASAPLASSGGATPNISLTGTVPSANGGTGVNNAGTLTNAANTTITGGGALALGGFTFTVPATGTAALLATNNLFSVRQDVRSSGAGLAAGLYVPWITGDALPTARFGSAASDQVGVRVFTGAGLAIEATTTSGLPLSASVSDAATNTVVTAAQLVHYSSGAVATGFGARLLTTLADSVNVSRTASEWLTTWATATSASRKARVVGTVFDTASREWIRGEADGSNPMIGFLGASATARVAITGSRGANAALASLLTELAAKGLITDSTII